MRKSLSVALGASDLLAHLLRGACQRLGVVEPAATRAHVGIHAAVRLVTRLHRRRPACCVQALPEAREAHRPRASRRARVACNWATKLFVIEDHVDASRYSDGCRVRLISAGEDGASADVCRLQSLCDFGDELRYVALLRAVADPWRCVAILCVSLEPWVPRCDWR